MNLEMEPRGWHCALQVGLGEVHPGPAAGPVSAAEEMAHMLVVWIGANDRLSSLPSRHSITLNQQNDF